MSNLFENVYNPDVLACIANLSNDEVFTPPEIANAMLDMLPQELFENPNTTFLDPCCKSGVFLREIAKRLIVGLEPIYPDLQERIDHIMQEQLYGIAITELTSLLSRRSLYCSKYPNSKYSISKFENVQGNLRFKKTKHHFKDGKCIWCGAPKNVFDRDESLEQHAYEWIHTNNQEDVFNMKFDVIIGNPPYQLSVGNEGGNKSKAKAIYHEFVSKSIKLNPRYLCMITPSRWMTRSTEGINDEWIDNMLSENKISVMHDFIDASMCFPGVEIKGGVNYFLWENNYNGKCNYFLHDTSNDITHRFDYLDPINSGIVVRDKMALSILEKINKVEGDYINNEYNNFSQYVSPKDFFTNKEDLTSGWKGFSTEKTAKNNIKYYLNKNIHNIEYGWVSIGVIPKNKNSIGLNKVYIPAAGGSGNDPIVLGKPFVGESNSVCSQTYLVIGYDPIKHNFTKEQCENIVAYIKTRFFRYLVSIKKKTQNGPRMVYQFVPVQDFSKVWSDDELFAKYSLTEEEISFIKSSINEME